MKLFLSKCKLYAFRYIKLKGFHESAEDDIAQDVAEVMQSAIFSYIFNRTAGFAFEKFMDTLKSVSTKE